MKGRQARSWSQKTSTTLSPVLPLSASESHLMPKNIRFLASKVGIIINISGLLLKLNEIFMEIGGKDPNI